MRSRKFIESCEEMEKILNEETIGTLSMASQDEPWAVPLNYAYVDGKILFHCAKVGRKLDCIRANPRVCFSVARQSGEVKRHAKGDVCHPDSDSVICLGTARIIDDIEERREVLNAFNRSYRPDAEDISAKDVKRCGAVSIEITEMTGRSERDGKAVYWKHVFAE